MDGRRLLIKDGGDFTGRPAVAGLESEAGPKGSNIGMSRTAQKILRVQKHPVGPTLFFGNLSFETTEDSLRKMLVMHWKQKAPEQETDQAVPAENPNAWIKKIRMGTFEDSGKCKGWAFVDFMSKEHATTALINPRNHRLEGRDLVVEFASPDAVRRGGGAGTKTHAKPTGQREPRSYEKADASPSLKRKSKPEAEAEAEAMDAVQTPSAPSPGKRRRLDDDAVPEFTRTDRKPRKDGKVPRTRAKPGAALAEAKRETASIVPSQGQKIVF